MVGRGGAISGGAVGDSHQRPAKSKVLKGEK
jgi:hypothetical protein